MSSPPAIAEAPLAHPRRWFLRTATPAPWPLRLAALLTFLFFLATAVRTGWTTPQTDFPNYYTAAKLVRAGQPLRQYYDWTWFARQMNYAGNGTQLGAYTPQTPLTMLPFLPLANFPVQCAKQIWLVLNVFFLAAIIGLLARVTPYHSSAIWLLMFCGYFSLRTNFIYGQYYVFLLLLLTLAFYFLEKQHLLAAGCMAGAAFALKLYGGPFLLYFAARRQWKALCGMCVATLLLAALALVLFGPADLHYYATQILPRSLAGGSIDPYNPGVPTFSTLLRRLFLPEAQLNPHPFWPAPWLFFFSRTFVSLAIVAFLFLGIHHRQATPRHDFAWLLVAAVVLSTSTASYTFILLLLPIVLLLAEYSLPGKISLVTFFILLTLPLHPVGLFPKVWLLFALLLFVGHRNFRAIPSRYALLAVAAAALFASLDARRQIHSYAQEPAQNFSHAVSQPGALFSSYPVLTPAGLFYQSMSNDRYVLRWVHDEQNKELRFPGQALQPRLSPDGTSIDFELVTNGASTFLRFIPATHQTTPAINFLPLTSPSPVISPDHVWSALPILVNDTAQIALRNLQDGHQLQLTGGNCNNTSPVWDLDSHSLVFASDCGRAFGLPALYRAPLPNPVP